MIRKPTSRPRLGPGWWLGTAARPGALRSRALLVVLEYIKGWVSRQKGGSNRRASCLHQGNSHGCRSPSMPAASVLSPASSWHLESRVPECGFFTPSVTVGPPGPGTTAFSGIRCTCRGRCRGHAIRRDREKKAEQDLEDAEAAAWPPCASWILTSATTYPQPFD